MPGSSFLGLIAIFLLTLAALAPAQQRGTVSGPDPVELRTEKNATAPVAATVNPGEPFTFEIDESDKKGEWAKVTLASGKAGWLPADQIRYFYDASDLPKKDPTGTSEIDDAARRLGFNYVNVTKLASQGDAKALKQFFTLVQEADGAAAESIGGMPSVVYHILGDEKFAKYLRDQPLAFQGQVRRIMSGEGHGYLQRHFPETTKLLFPSEMVAWPSPDGRFAIRKVFSDPFDLRTGKITRAELIDKKTGKVLLDMTADDIGEGPKREGKILWAPDSKRFASVSSDLITQQGNLFSEPRPDPLKMQTVVYQASGDTWVRVELPFDKVPGRDKDKELERAVLGHDYIEAVRWTKANVLRLERHEYFELKKPVPDSKFENIVGTARWYWITATITPEGKATLVWQVRKLP